MVNRSKKPATKATRKPNTKPAKARMGMDPLAWIEDEQMEPAIEAQHANASELLVSETATVEPEMGPLRLQLAVRFTVIEVSDIYEQLNQALASGRSVDINVDGLETIDGAAMQLLVAARRAALDRGVEWNWFGHSEAFDRAARLTGLAEQLIVS